MLEAENRRKSQEVNQLQVQGAQDAQKQQQSRQEVLQTQRLATEAEAARDGARREVGGLPELQRGWEAGLPGQLCASTCSSCLPLPSGCSRGGGTGALAELTQGKW